MVAAEAGRLLLAVREEIGFYDPYDLGDAGGDRRANTLILKRLRELRPPDDAVLSEEAADNPARVHADRVWIVDPVDGTREFSMPGARRLGGAHRAVAARQNRSGGDIGHRGPGPSPTRRWHCPPWARSTAPTR